MTSAASRPWAAISATRWMLTISVRPASAASRLRWARHATWPDQKPDHEQQQRGLDVVGGVDGERQIWLGVKEVERQGRHDGREGATGAAPVTPATTTTTTEDERNARVLERVTDGHQGGGHDDGPDPTHQEAEGRRRTIRVHMLVLLRRTG